MKYLVVLPLFIGCLSFLAWSSEITQSEWEGRNSFQKIASVFEEELDQETIDIDDIEDIKKINDVKIQVQLEAMIEDALDHISRDEIEGDLDGQEFTATIDEPELTEVNLYFVEGKTVVIGLNFYQNGGARRDREPVEQSHYETSEEAEAAGIDPGADVCWFGEAYFLWDGKTWSPLEYTNSEGRGFNWCGW